MPVAFGFSVSDFIAALELVGTVIDALRESSNSGALFRSLLNELYALETALLHVKRLDMEDYSTVKVNSLRQAASQCQHTIDEFWKKIQKYQPHLQSRGTNSKVKDAWYKVKWALCAKEDIEKFRAEIRGHTSSLNILLSIIQIKAMTLDKSMDDSRHNSLASMIQSLTCNAMGKLSAITATVAESVRQGKQLLEASAQIVQTNLRVFQVVHDIHLSILRIPGQVQRQQPVYLIDAFNKESPFHLEFVRSANGLLAVLKDNLKETGCGPDMIDRGEFVVEELGTQRVIDFTMPWDNCFYPGQRVAMSMVFKGLEPINSTCPRCGNGHDESIEKEITCAACGTIFRRIEEVDKEFVEDRQVSGQGTEQTSRHPGYSSPNNESQNPVYGPSRPEKRKRGRHDALTDVRKFRRIQMITCVEASGSSESASEFPLYQQRASSYWSLSEEIDFRDGLRYFGTDFQAIANYMGSKTETMIKNHFQKYKYKYRELIDAAAAVDLKRERGEPLGPPSPRLRSWGFP